MVNVIIGIIIIITLLWFITPKSTPEILVDFKALSLPTTPNYYLSCPAQYCQADSAHASPVYPVSISQLDGIWLKLMAEQPRTQLVASKPLHYTYVMRTKWLRFPDYLNVALISIDEKHASIAILSQSKYGYSDLGVNAKRVKVLLQQLSDRIEHIKSE